MPTLKDRFSRIGMDVHIALHKLTGGRVGGNLRGMPVIILTTKGRKSGKPRTTPLTSHPQDDGTIAIVASYGGDDRHPNWYQNLSADPEVEVTLGRETRTMKARSATPEEKQRLWPGIVERYPGYQQYEERSTRDIPVVILSPTD